MNASIPDLSGKYYGTKVIYGDEHELTIWTHDKDFTPSTRQLAYWELTLEEAKEDDMMCDSHYETQEDYDVAVKICYALRGEFELLQSTITQQADQIKELKEIVESIFDFAPTHKREVEDSRHHFCVYCGEPAGKHLDRCPVKRFALMNSLEGKE